MSWQQKHPGATIILLLCIPPRRVNPTLSSKSPLRQDVSLPTCPLSKFSFSSSRLLAPPVRRITLGIALGTCCMELLTRSMFVCFSQPRNENNKKNKNVQSINRPDCTKNPNRSAPTMAGSGPCCAGLDVPFTRSFGLSVHHPSQWQEQSERHQVNSPMVRGRCRLLFHFFKIKAPVG